MTLPLRATIQLCTYNRAHLLGRVLDACFEQTVPRDCYEVVLVDDGSADDTPQVIAAAQARAACLFTVVVQSNAGLARARNAGIARARGERIIFIDDDVLPVPSFVAAHLASHRRAPRAIVRGAVINSESFERLPTPTWSLANYSGNFFWTSNVSVPLATLRSVGNFSEAFREYGWEDIELGLRLRAAGVRAVFNRYALAFHYKPRPGSSDIAGMLRRARAQARTAVQLRRMHPSWRVRLATGEDPLQLALHRAFRAAGVLERLERRIGSEGVIHGAAGRALENADESAASDMVLDRPRLRAVRALERETYFRELNAARSPAADERDA
ncbi:MAG: glycosyltransferase family 2 protein [Candidatus Eremiobacteraeota bacterium]|nr:glycosyltransferase family 2 protein [Candidatus Eremiobacteraeota bacterium]